MEEAEDDIRLETAADREARRLADAYSNSDNIPAPQVGLPLPLTPAPYPALTILPAFCHFCTVSFHHVYVLALQDTAFGTKIVLWRAVILNAQDVITVIHTKAYSLVLGAA